MLSVIIPAYQEEKMIPIAAKTISEILGKENIPHEIIFIDDGSKDGTWSQILTVTKIVNGIHGISFSKNFGKEAAIFAGLAYAKGNTVVVIDCDLQHPPEKIVEMYRLWQKGYKVVEGVKVSRGKEGFLHKIAACVFYKLISCATGVDMRNASDFKLMDRDVVNVILKMPEHRLFFRAISAWVGFPSAIVEFEVQERRQGTTKWNIKSLTWYALTNITSFSSAPLQIVTFSGIIFLIFAIMLIVQTLVKFLMGMALEGFTTIILLQLISSSILMIAVGIIGYYIAKIYDEVKGRPRYIVYKETGKTDAEDNRD